MNKKIAVIAVLALVVGTFSGVTAFARDAKCSEIEKYGKETVSECLSNIIEQSHVMEVPLAYVAYSETSCNAMVLSRYSTSEAKFVLVKKTERPENTPRTGDEVYNRKAHGFTSDFETGAEVFRINAESVHVDVLASGLTADEARDAYITECID